MPEAFSFGFHMRASVKRLIEMRSKLETERHQFGIKHGFVFKRPQNFKDCIVIRWKFCRKYEIIYPRLDVYGKILHHLSEKYDLYVEEDPLRSADLRFLKIGIYVFPYLNYQAWAIPNDNKEIQDYVLSQLPKWAEVSYK